MKPKRKKYIVRVITFSPPPRLYGIVSFRLLKCDRFAVTGRVMKIT